MKYNMREIYDIGRKVLKGSVVGFESFLEESTFNSILENPYIMKRPLEELSAWVLLDFCESGESYEPVLRFLLKNQGVDDEDLDYLIEVLRDSYVSLFEITKNGKDYKFHDKILDLDYDIEYTPTLANTYRDKGLFRVFGNDEKKLVLQSIRLMDDIEYFTYYSNLLKIFEEIKDSNEFTLMDKGFLKSNLLNMLAICEITADGLYGEINNFDFEFSDEELDLAFYDSDLAALVDLREFRKIIPDKDDNFILAFFDLIFTKIYRKYLVYAEKSFKNYNLDYRIVFKELAKSGAFNDKNQFMLSVDLVLTFYKKLAKMGRNVDFPLKTLEEVKNNIFDYANILGHSISGFYYDVNLPNLISKHNKNYFVNKFIENYDNFLTFLDINYVNLLTSGDLSPAMLKGFIEEAEIIPTKYVKTYKNKHFPLIQLFLNFTIEKGLTYLYDPGKVQELYLTDEADEYLQFDDLMKYSIWIDTLSKEEFLKGAFGNNYEDYKNLVLNLIKRLLNDENVDLEDFSKEEKPIIYILIDLDIIENKKLLSLTKFGKDLYNYYRVDKKKDNIIEIDFNEI